MQALRRAQRDTDLGIFLNCHAEPAEALYIAGRSDPIRRSNAPQLFGERFGPSFGRTRSLSVTVQGRFGRLSVTLQGSVHGNGVVFRQAQRDTTLGIFMNCHAERAEALYIAGRSDPLR